MSVRIAQHIRSNVVGYLALFVALSGTAYAVDGPLAGQDQVGSADIINGEVRTDDLHSGAVATGKIATDAISNDSSLAGDGSTKVAPSAIGASEIQTDAIGNAELGVDAVLSSNVAPNSLFSSDMRDGSLTGADISDGSVASAEVATNSLTGADIDEATLSGVDANDAHDQSCDPETVSYLHCAELSFTAGRPMSVLLMTTYQYHGIDDNPLGDCRTTLDGANVSSERLYNSDHTSEIGGSSVDIVAVDAGSHTVGFDCFEFGPDDHDLVVTDIDLAEVQLAVD